VFRPAQTIFFDGGAGPIETLVDEPATAHGLALVAHPHPLLGGTNRNKVVYTLAHCLRDLGYVALRPNFRGVGRSIGAHDEGNGETHDLLAILEQARQRWAAATPLSVVLAGFSFGAFVQTRVGRRLASVHRAPERLVLVALAAGRLHETASYQPEPTPPGTIVIHGGRDAVVPLANVLAYAEPLDLPITVIPGADHFFHGRLHLIRQIVEGSWQRL
jgi:alpha/beta superfamily hydrolase